MGKREARNLCRRTQNRYSESSLSVSLAPGSELDSMRVPSLHPKHLKDLLAATRSASQLHLIGVLRCMEVARSLSVLQKASRTLWKGTSNFFFPKLKCLSKVSRRPSEARGGHTQPLHASEGLPEVSERKFQFAGRPPPPQWI